MKSDRIKKSRVGEKYLLQSYNNPWSDYFWNMAQILSCHVIMNRIWMKLPFYLLNITSVRHSVSNVFRHHMGWYVKASWCIYVPMNSPLFQVMVCRSMPSLYLRECCCIVTWSLRKKMKINLKSYYDEFHSRKHLTKCQQFCSSLNVLNYL